MERRRIEIRNADPIKETWLGPKTEAEKARSLAIMQRLDQEQRLHPGAEVKIEYRNGEGFFLCVTTKEDQAMERRFAESRAIYERQIVDPRTKIRKFFLY